MGYTTASQIQDELRLSTAFSAATLPSLSAVTTWIEEDSAHIDQLSGRVFASTSYTEDIDYDGSDRIQLKNAPIISVTSLLYSSGGDLGSTGYALNDTQVENTDFAVYDERGEILVLTQNWQPKEGNKRMQITYTAGYSTIPLTVEKLATKMVAKRVLDSAIENDISERKSGKSISVGSISIVKTADYGVGQYKEMQGDITMLKNELGSQKSGMYRYTNY